MWMWLLSIPAFAGVPVVVDADPELAAQAPGLVATRTGLPDSQLSTVVLDDLLAAPPQTLGQAVMRRCAGQPTRLADAHSELLRAQSAWQQQQQRLAALDHLDLAVAQLGCLGERVDTDTAAQIFLLRGALEAQRAQQSQQSQQSDAALRELQTALAFDPELGWTSAVPIEGQVVLAEARQAVPQLRLTVQPPGTSSGPWLDGRSVAEDGAQVSVAPGLHLAQYASAAGIRSAWMVIGGDASLVVPASYRRPVLEQLADPATRPSTEALLQATLPDFEAAYVAHQGWLWLLTLQGDLVHTETLTQPPPPAEDAPPKRRRRRQRAD